MSKHILFGIALAVLLLSGCASNPDVQLVELSKNTVVYDEIVRINNCGGKGDSEQTKSRDFATTVEFGAGVSAGYQSIVQGSLSAKYSEYRNTSVSQRLVAPPGTNMEFVLRWSDDVRAGNVQVNGKSGTYEVRCFGGASFRSGFGMSRRCTNALCFQYPTHIPTNSSSDRWTYSKIA